MIDELPNKYIIDRKRWEECLANGDGKAAEAIYFLDLLPLVTKLARERLAAKADYSALVALLGFTPETVVLATQILQPKKLVVMHTPETERFLDIVRDNVSIPAAHFHHEQFDHGPNSTNAIYEALTRGLVKIERDEKIIIEITGGKKFMAIQLGIAAALLEKRRGFSIDLCSVGYDKYLPEYRKPIPETSFLEILDNPIDAPLAVMDKHFGGAGLIVDPVFRARDLRVIQKSLFVIMPFGESWSDHVWKNISEIGENLGYICTRGDGIYGQNVMEDVWKGILSASVLIADTTTKNANVFYEIGIAHTLGKQVILLGQNAADIPFDLRHMRHLIYENSLSGASTLREKLPKFIADAS